jgi:hypothetical protein
MTFGVFMASATALIVLVGLTGRLVVWVIERLPE